MNLDYEIALIVFYSIFITSELRIGGGGPVGIKVYNLLLSFNKIAFRF